jgi:type IV pilus assembly protein PilW
MNNICAFHRPPLLQCGVTLIELMISLTLGLVLLVGIGSIYVGSNQTYRVQDQNARIQESGRFALDVLGRSIRQAGYWNMPSSSVPPSAGFSGTPIGGTNGTSGAADTVTIQHDAVAGDRDCEGAVTGSVVAQEIISLDAPNLELECDSNVDATVDPQPIISNVEDLQFLYGVDTDGDQSANLYTATPANWSLVVSVRACVLIRSENTGISATAQRYLNCAGALGTATGTAIYTTATDTRLRRIFVATLSLRNRVTRLP